MTSPAPFFTIDTSEWPVVVMRLPRAPIDDAEIDSFQARFLAVLSLARNGSSRVSKTKLLIAMELNGLVDASLKQQMRAARFIQDVRPYVVDTIVGTALVTASPLVRTILTTITTIQPLASEHVIFEKEGDALTWLRARLPSIPPPA